MSLTPDDSQPSNGWVELEVNDEVLRVPHPDHPEFEDLVSEVSRAHSSSSNFGPVSSSYAERIVVYGGHRFLVTGDPEGGGQEIELVSSQTIVRRGWSHPSALMVMDSAGNEISLGYDEDLDHEDQFENLADLEEDDVYDVEDERLAMWREALERAEDLLSDLRIDHQGVYVVGPDASTTMPSSEPWLAFRSPVSIEELSAKCGPVSMAILDGEELAFTDQLPLAVAARLAWPEPLVRLTADRVAVLDTELRAFVVDRPRVDA